jgi:hypothetical protein
VKGELPGEGSVVTSDLSCGSCMYTATHMDHGSTIISSFGGNSGFGNGDLVWR